MCVFLRGPADGGEIVCWVGELVLDSSHRNTPGAISLAESRSRDSLASDTSNQRNEEEAIVEKGGRSWPI